MLRFLCTFFVALFDFAISVAALGAYTLTLQRPSLMSHVDSRLAINALRSKCAVVYANIQSLFLKFTIINFRPIFAPSYISSTSLSQSRFLPPKPSGETWRVVNIMCACGLPSPLSCRETSAIMPLSTKFSLMNSRSSAFCSSKSNSICRAISISRANRASCRLSLASTARQSV